MELRHQSLSELNNYLAINHGINEAAKTLAAFKSPCTKIRSLGTKLLDFYCFELRASDQKFSGLRALQLKTIRAPGSKLIGLRALEQNISGSRAPWTPTPSRSFEEFWNTRNREIVERWNTVEEPQRRCTGQYSNSPINQSWSRFGKKNLKRR